MTPRARSNRSNVLPRRYFPKVLFPVECNTEQAGAISQSGRNRRADASTCGFPGLIRLRHVSPCKLPTSRLRDNVGVCAKRNLWLARLDLQIQLRSRPNNRGQSIAPTFFNLSWHQRSRGVRLRVTMLSDLTALSMCENKRREECQ